MGQCSRSKCLSWVIRFSRFIYRSAYAIYSPPTHVRSSATVEFHTMHHQHVTASWRHRFLITSFLARRIDVPMFPKPAALVSSLEQHNGVRELICIYIFVFSSQHGIQAWTWSVHITVRPYAHLVCSSGFQTVVCYEGSGDGEASDVNFRSTFWYRYIRL
jgi:hypothetical protein